MKFIADFHIHSKYARATSSDMDLEHLARWAKIKGIKVLGTGDFTHPLWLKELKEKLKPAGPGIFEFKDIFFILTGEISCIFSKNGKLRKIHLIVFAPSFEVAQKINTQLSWIGNLSSDGRPTLGIDVQELVKIILNISADCFLIPAHIWTPWFSLFGSKSGFDSIEECFGQYSKYIWAAETGLSADPSMCWRLSSLDKISLISNSDSHSPRKIGREANIFDTEIDYFSIISAIKSKDPKKFLSTIEFFPEEGKYHYDGHRACQISFSPSQTKKYNGICPICQKPLTIGVLSRVEGLADRPEGFVPPGAIPYQSLVPLEEIIAEAMGSSSLTKAVENEYFNLIKKLGNEFYILLEASEEELKSTSSPRIAQGIMKVRKKEVFLEPGYDGVYGKIKIFSEKEERKLPGQKTLF